jgi:hypothetical protein
MFRVGFGMVEFCKYFWGIKGPREHYARQYLNKFEIQTIDS